MFLFQNLELGSHNGMTPMNHDGVIYDFHTSTLKNALSSSKGCGCASFIGGSASASHGIISSLRRENHFDHLGLLNMFKRVSPRIFGFLKTGVL